MDICRVIVSQISKLSVVVNPDKAIKLCSKASAVYCFVDRGVASWPGGVVGLHFSDPSSSVLGELSSKANIYNSITFEAKQSFELLP